MWMNDSEIEEAADRYRLHPVLGPATRTLQNLAAWVNGNSDGWPYWRQPARAADKLMTLIGGYRDWMDDPDRADVTAAAYRAALRPLKTFRTKQANDRAVLDRETLFEICEPGTGGEVWAAEQAVEDARKVWSALVSRTAAAWELLDQAEAELEAATGRQNLTELRELAASHPGQLSPQLARLAEFGAGDQLWVLPAAGQGSVGFPATVTGLAWREGGGCLIYRAAGGQPGREYSPISLADARARFWILDADGANVVAGGWADEQRTTSTRDRQYPGCQVVQGSRFVQVPAATA
jgi:hypothetical protein